MPEDVVYDLPLKHIVRTVMLPLRTVTEEQFRKAKLEYDSINRQYEQTGLAADSPDSIPLRMQDRVPYSIVAGIVSRYKMQVKRDIVDIELHGIRLGKSALVNYPFELYQDYAMQIKARSPCAQTIIAQLSGNNLGYLPTSHALSGGSYSSNVADGYCGPEGGAVLVEKTLEIIGELFEK